MLQALTPLKTSTKNRADSASGRKTRHSAASAASKRSRGLDTALLAECRSGWTLPRPFYRDESVYRLDLERVWRTGWLFAGHSCEISEPGSYFTLELDTDSLIVIRGADGAIHAHHNVCRHRGSLVCAAPTGQVSRLICPYHQWTYSLEGKLIACRGMHAGLDKSQFSLRPARVEEVEGLVFVSLADKPLPFAPARDALAPLLKPQGLRRAKVAKVLDYLVPANWKLLWENNRECYHCNLNHPQYIKANFDHYNADDTTPRVREALNRVVARSEQKRASDRLAPTHRQSGMAVFPDADKNIWFSANRTPLVDGWVSESMDGKQVARLMGDYTDADTGTLRVRALPNFWNHSSCDHGVSTRLLPVGPQQTAVRVCWLVDEKSIEGRDYDLSRLLPFWQLTSEQDWLICERQQKGVNSSAYRPGPYSTFKEYNVASFVKWYLGCVEREA